MNEYILMETARGMARDAYTEDEALEVYARLTEGPSPMPVQIYKLVPVEVKKTLTLAE